VSLSISPLAALIFNPLIILSALFGNLSAHPIFVDELSYMNLLLCRFLEENRSPGSSRGDPVPGAGKGLIFGRSGPLVEGFRTVRNWGRRRSDFVAQLILFSGIYVYGKE